MAEEIIPAERLEVQVMDQPDKRALAAAKRKEKRAEERERLFFKGAEVVDAGMAAFEMPELDPENPNEPPAEWVERYGREGALRRMRIAAAALQSNKDAPYALKMAMAVVQSAMKEREAEDEKGANIQNLHVNFINVEAPKFPTQKLEDED